MAHTAGPDEDAIGAPIAEKNGRRVPTTAFDNVPGGRTSAVGRRTLRIILTWDAT